MRIEPIKKHSKEKNLDKSKKIITLSCKSKACSKVGNPAGLKVAKSKGRKKPSRNEMLLLQIAKFARLKFDAHIEFEESDALLRSAVDILEKEKLINREAKQHIRDEQYDERFEQYINLEEGEEYPIEDLLGFYLPEKGKIIIFTEMCKLVAAHLGLNENTLRRVVLYHEAAHAVTHLGIDKHGNDWSNFNCADSKDKELFAQAYPFIIFRNESMQRELETFVALAQKQSYRYNQWLKYIPLDRSHLNKDLLRVRDLRWSISFVTSKEYDVLYMIMAGMDQPNHVTEQKILTVSNTCEIMSYDGGVEKVVNTLSSRELSEIFSCINNTGLLDIKAEYFETAVPDQVTTVLTVIVGDVVKKWINKDATSKKGRWGGDERIQKLETIVDDMIKKYMR